MDPITILSEEKLGNSWRVKVQVGANDDTATNHTVQVDEGTYDRLAEGRVTPGALVEETFRFLLEREPKESILTNFDLDTVMNYFPDYEEKIVTRL